MASHPSKIGKYNIEGVLGRGGMGVVYKAVDPQIGRYVAIKMITSSGDATMLDRFKSEARSTGSLQCPNIVTVYDFGEQDGNPFLVMQFLEGSSLDALIREEAPLTLSEKLSIVMDVCCGLSYAHERGVIHRDIKPGNIMVVRDGVNEGSAVIVDFGIARISGNTRITRTDQIVGSVHYMSAEQLQGKELDNRADIYSTGVVLFQLLTGVLPFDSPDAAATLLKIVNDPPPPLSTYLKDYPIELEAVVSRALAKRREERYPNAQDLSFDLMQVQERIKSDTVAKLVQKAELSTSREEWTKARETLQQVLRIDRQHAQAQSMMNAVQERLRQQQNVEQARGLRTQADEAYMDQRFDDALRLLDQATDLDTQNGDLRLFRDTVRAAKEKSVGLRRALRRAEAALQDGDFDEARIAINEAFRIDPNDTQAKAIRLVISQHAGEKSRHEQVQKLLDRARNQIAARDFAEAFATLKTAESLDSTSNELKGVVKMAVSAREQDRRRAETEELREQIEAALIREDYAGAVARAEEGLRTFPKEQSLLKLKTLAEAQRVRVEQKKFAREEFSRASSLADGGDLRQALVVLENAMQQVSGNSELESFASTLRERISRGQSASQEARSDTVRAREALAALDAGLARQTNPAKWVQLAEEAARTNPDNPGIRRRLVELQQVRIKISAAIDRARESETGRQLSAALAEWRQLREIYPQVPEFEAQVRRLEMAMSGKEATAPVPLPPSARKSGPGPSATRIVGAEAIPAAAVTHGGVSKTSAAAPPETIAVFPQTARIASPQVVTGPKEKLPSRKYIGIIGAVVVSILMTIYLMARGDKNAVVKIISDPPDTQVIVGEQKCRTPCELKLKLGSYAVQAARDGYTPLTKDVSVAPETKELSLTLTIAPIVSQIVSGELAVQTNVDATQVIIDGVLKGVTGQDGKFEVEIPEGNHEIAVAKDGYDDPPSIHIDVPKGGKVGHQFVLVKTVAQVPAPVVSFVASPDSIQLGQSTTLIWKTQNARKITIEPEIGTVGKSSSKQVRPTKTTNYILTAKGPGSTATRSLTVNVELPKPKPVAIEAFGTAESTITEGASTTLSWTTQNATEISLEPGFGVVQGTGILVRPPQTTRYTLTARGAGATVQKTFTITVKKPVAVAKVTARQCVDRFQKAVQSLRIDELQKIWPSLAVDKRHNDYINIFREAEAIAIGEECGEPGASAAGTASLQCQETATFTKKEKPESSQSTTVDFVCKNTASGWMIEKRSVKKSGNKFKKLFSHHELP